LLLPLAGALAGSVVFTASCDYDCGDMGGRGLFVLVLLCTPFAAAGILVLAPTAGRWSGRMARVATKLVVAAVASCTLILTGAALAAGVEGAHQLTTDPPTGIWWLVIATVLAAMAAAAVLALRAAWRRRH
jgi:MFS family permease